MGKGGPAPPKSGDRGSPAPAPKRPRLEALTALRFLAELQIVGFHFYTSSGTPWMKNFNEWGSCPLTFFFVLSGFIFGWLYGGAGRSARPLDWWDFMAKRFAGLYPLYLSSIMCGFLVMNTLQPHPAALALVLLFAANKLLPSAFENPISTPAWTVGAFLALYAVMPSCLRLIKSASPWTRAWVLPPLFFLLSMAEPAVRMGVNTGILHPYTKAIGVCSAANFLQGLNLGLLFLEHDWSRHPMLLQRTGASAAMLSILLIASLVPVSGMPVFVRVWRDHGLLSPLYCLLIWYAARDRDVLCVLLKTWPMRFVGNISYGMYLYQTIVYNYLITSWPSYLMVGYVPAMVFLPVLVATAAFGVHYIQDIYTQPLYQYLRAKTSRFITGEHSPGKRLAYVVSLLLESRLVRLVSWLCFVGVYTVFVNYQACKPITCYSATWSAYDVPSGLAERTWFSTQDLNWTVNAWTLPCERRAPLAADSAGLSALVRLARACLLPAMVGLLLCYLDRPLRCLRRWAGRRAVRRATKARARGGDEEGKEEEGGAGRRGLRPRLFVRVLVAGREEEEAVETKVQRHVDCLSSVMGGGRLGKALAGVVVEVHLASPPSQAMVEGLSSHLNGRTPAVVVVDGRQEGGPSGEAKQPPPSHPELPASCALWAPLSLVLLVGSNKRASSEARPGDVVVTLPPECTRLRARSFESCLCRLLSLPGREGGGMLSCGLSLDGGDDDDRLVPNLITLAHLGSKQAPRVAMAVLGEEDLPAAGQAPVVLEVEGIGRYFPDCTWAGYLRNQRGRVGCRAGGPASWAVLLLRVLSEAAMHVGFVVSQAVLLLTPVHANYVHGLYQLSGSGFDCSNGHGWGVHPYRWAAAGFSALYTGLYFGRFLATYQPSDGVLRQAVLLFFLLLSLPVIAAMEAITCLLALWPAHYRSKRRGGREEDV